MAAAGERGSPCFSGMAGRWHRGWDVERLKRLERASRQELKMPVLLLGGRKKKVEKNHLILMLRKSRHRIGEKKQ